MDDSRVIAAELGPGEQMLWAGRPFQGLALRASDAIAIPFSLLWGGFAIFWESSVFSQGAPLLFKLWGIPFVLVGLYLIVGRFFFDSWSRKKTYYGLTTKRVLIVSGIYSREIKSLELGSLNDMSLSERSSGSGSIVFGPGQAAFGGWPGSFRRNGQVVAPSFDMIPKVRQIYNHIREAKTAAGRDERP